MAKKKVTKRKKKTTKAPENKMLKGAVENKAGTWVHSPTPSKGPVDDKN